LGTQFHLGTHPLANTLVSGACNLNMTRRLIKTLWFAAVHDVGGVDARSHTRLLSLLTVRIQVLHGYP
jgi:hypothetical protein